MKLALLGGDGQLGSDCSRVFQEKNEVFRLSSNDIDITDSANTETVLSSLAPDVVINCAAYTKVDDCESNEETAFRVNAQGAGNVAGTCAAIGALMVHLSTDYVFDGKKEVPAFYSEADLPSPLSVYGRSKLKGEEAVMSVLDRYIIVRTAWLYGIYGNNFLKTILRMALAGPGKEIRVVDDQFGSPTWTLRLALQIETLLKARGQGIYHATSEGYCSWFELAAYFLKKMEVDHCLVPCTTREFPRPAHRPANSILENARLKRNNINRMTGWRHGVDLFVSRFRSDLLNECR